ncbi:MAG TPA: GTPase [Gammaproteobacteria bacterium]|nr:GTPase [Gammaproteobacteria bacterium]
MVAERLTKTWRALRDAIAGSAADAELADKIAEQARREAPVVWLVGKVQSGKTSIVHAITGHPAAEIGAGYKPCTRTARVFDFPEDAPVIRFLDTSGFGEVGYDPAEDVAELERKAHVVLAVARAMDPEQRKVLDVLRAVRRRHPDWAVVLAQTTLHEGYPEGGDHPRYEDLGAAPGLDDLRRSLEHQADAFRALPGRGAVYCVPIDLTPPEEGFNDPSFGLGALLEALEHAGSAGMASILESLRARDHDARAARARPHILGYAAAAGASDVLPLIGWVGVPTIQGKMLHTIARIYGLRWDARTLRRFAASLGTGTVARIGIGLGARQLAKLVPGYGQTVGAAAAGAGSFAVTYALGRAACYFLRIAKVGGDDSSGVARIYRESLREAFDLVRSRSRPASAPIGPGASRAR